MSNQDRYPYRNSSSARASVLRFTILLLTIACVCLAAGALGKLTAQDHPSKTTRTPVLPTKASQLQLPTFLLPATGSSPQPSAALPSNERPTTTPPAQDQVDIEAILSRMSLDQKVGQMIMSSMDGQSASGAVELVQKYDFGGITYHPVNISTRDQLRQLSADLQTLASQNAPAVPLFITVDHEGGQGDHFNELLTNFPATMALGAANNPNLTYQVAANAARQLHWLGVNVSLSPVLDVLSEPKNTVISIRSYGGDPNLVTQMGERYLSGLQDNQVIGALKHFPGHGSTVVDSHKGLPLLNSTLAELQQRDLIPFAAVINNDPGMVMVGHLADNKIDPSGRPASLSPIFVQNILRGDLHYQGVVITDALEMGAISQNYGGGEAAILAVQAGCDILLYSSTPAAIQAWNVIRQAVRDGRISEDQINRSVRRILELKRRFHLFSHPGPSDEQLSLSDGDQVAQEVARKAIYGQNMQDISLKDASSVIILSPDKLPIGQRGGDNLSLLGELIRAHHPAVDEWIYPTEDAKRARGIIDQGLAKIPDHAVILVVTWDAYLNSTRQNDPTQQAMIDKAIQTGKRVVIVAANSPFDLLLVPAQQPAIATFGALPVQIEALVDSLFSSGPYPGTMPVTLRR